MIHDIAANGDLTDRAFLAGVVAEARPDQVYHLAGFASGAGGDRARIFQVNVEATLDLLRGLADAGRPCRVQLASSGYVYGATDAGRPALETDALEPHGEYAESKAAMEMAAESFLGESRESDGALQVVATRAFNHTGPHQTTIFSVPAFASQIARIERGDEAPVVRVGNLDARRDFLDVRDVVRAYRLLLDSPATERAAPFRVVNVASGTPVAMREIVERLIAHARVPVEVEADPSRLRSSDIPECAGDSALLARETGWSPTIALDQTLADTLDWWRSLPDPALGR